MMLARNGVTLILTLILGGVGGYLFSLAHLPLAWMLGAMTFCAIAAMMQLPIGVPSKIRPFTAIILGTMLGSSFGPTLFGQMLGWLVPLLGLVLFLVTATLVSFAYFTRVVKLDRTTALFAGMPGGIVEMVMLGHENGADEQAIALVHAARIFLVVLILPFILRLMTGADLGTAPIAVVEAMTIADASWFVGAAVLGAAAGWLLRLPIRYLLGPMLVSALVHGMGWTSFKLPTDVISALQVVLGATIGCRFAGATARQILKILLQSVGASALLLGLTFAFAITVSFVTAEPLLALVLAYAPGGLAEMSLVALSLNIEVAFVVTHHLVRVIVVTAGASPLFNLWSARARLAPIKQTTS